MIRFSGTWRNVIKILVPERLLQTFLFIRTFRVILLVSGTEEESIMAANCLWLVTNSKPCPNCKSPIQKNEGCNHMKCSKVSDPFPNG